MRRLGAILIIALGSGSTGALAASVDCPKPGSGLSHSQQIARDPTVPAIIGGCGLGTYKLHQYKKQQRNLQFQQQMIGPKRPGSGENL